MSEELKGEYKPIWEVIGEIGARVPAEERAWFSTAEMMPVNVKGIRAELRAIEERKRKRPYRMRDIVPDLHFMTTLNLALGPYAVEQLQKEEEEHAKEAGL